MAFKPKTNSNANHFLSGGADNKRTFAHGAGAGAGAGAAGSNAFSSLKSFISPFSSEEVQVPHVVTVQAPYDKNVDFPALPSVKAAPAPAAGLCSSVAAPLSYRRAVVAMDAQQQTAQDRIQKEMKRELEAKELVYEQLRRDTARSRDVATALVAAANYDISDISESIVD